MRQTVLFIAIGTTLLAACRGFGIGEAGLEATRRPTTEAHAERLTQEALPPDQRVTPDIEDEITVAEYMQMPEPTRALTLVPRSTDDYSLPELLPYPNQPMSDGLLLARLGVAECRGMGQRREQCHFSVMSTVMTRIRWRFVSDGTVYGTLDWGVESNFPQFVPWVTRGCGGIAPAACNDDEPIQWAVNNAYAFLAGERIGGTCEGYVYYNSIPGGDRECLLTGNGQFVEFFAEYDPSLQGPRTIPPTPTPAPTPTPTPRVAAQFSEGVLLTDLGIAECREFSGDMRDLCHLSLISLVYARINNEYKSDGTLTGTLAWGLDEGEPVFNPWIVEGCDSPLVDVCLDRQSSEWALENSYAYLSNQPLDGACLDYVEFTETPNPLNSCILQQGGLFIGFYNPSDLESE